MSITPIDLTDTLDDEELSAEALPSEPGAQLAIIARDLAYLRRDHRRTGKVVRAIAVKVNELSLVVSEVPALRTKVDGHETVIGTQTQERRVLSDLWGRLAKAAGGLTVISSCLYGVYHGCKELACRLGLLRGGV